MDQCLWPVDVVAGCGHWVWSLGGALNDDRWSGLLINFDIPTLFSNLFSGQSSTLGPTSHFIVSENVFLLYYNYIYDQTKSSLAGYTRTARARFQYHVLFMSIIIQGA